MISYTTLRNSVLILAVATAALADAQTITTIAGTGTAGFLGDNGEATTARVNLPTSICRDIFGNVYIADRFNHRVRRIDQDGIITTVAGTGMAGYSGDGGPALSAQLNQPVGIAVDGLGNVFFSDHFNQRVRRIDVDGTLTTVAGTGTAGIAGDGGPALSAQFNFPSGLFLHGTDLYIADRSNDRIRKLDLLTDTLSTVAGNGLMGAQGDGGPATAERMNRPIAVCVDAQNMLFIADENNDRIRRVDLSTGVITTVAGTGTAGFLGDGGQATAARLNKPSGVAVDLAGNLYIGDRVNQRIRRVGTNGVISTIAGTGTIGFLGDGGPATAARLNYPRELFSDGSGNIYFADTDNNRIRKITYCLLPTVPTVTASTLSPVCAGDEVSLFYTSGLLNAATAWQWYANGCGLESVGSGTFITVTPQQTTTYYVRGEGDCVTPYGCASITVEVLDALSFPDFPEFWCVTELPVPMSGGQPEGGIYAGPGVSAGIFDPSAAGVGTHTLTYSYSAPQGCILTSELEVTVDFCTGIDASRPARLLELYPNPVLDRLFVRAAGSVTHAELFDATGRRVGAWSPMVERFELPMEGLPGGLYLLRARQRSGSMVVERVVKE